MSPWIGPKKRRAGPLSVSQSVTVPFSTESAIRRPVWIQGNEADAAPSRRSSFDVFRSQMTAEPSSPTAASRSPLPLHAS